MGDDHPQGLGLLDREAAREQIRLVAERATAARTRFFRLGLTNALSLSIAETVATETRARAATSQMLAMCVAV